MKSLVASFLAFVPGLARRLGPGRLPFLYVQLSNYKRQQQQPQESPWARVREAQLFTLALPYRQLADGQT